MTLVRKFLIVSALAALSMGLVVPAQAQAGKRGNCLTDQQIQTQIASGQIQSWPAIKRLAGIAKYQEVSDVRVCLINGVPFYQVNVVSPNGEAKKVVINALDGSS